MTELLVIPSVVRHEQCQLVQLYEYTLAGTFPAQLNNNRTHTQIINFTSQTLTTNNLNYQNVRRYSD